MKIIFSYLLVFLIGFAIGYVNRQPCNIPCSDIEQATLYVVGGAKRVACQAATEGKTLEEAVELGMATFNARQTEVQNNWYSKGYTINQIPTIQIPDFEEVWNLCKDK